MPTLKIFGSQGVFDLFHGIKTPKALAVELFHAELKCRSLRELMKENGITVESLIDELTEDEVDWLEPWKEK